MFNYQEYEAIMNVARTYAEEYKKLPTDKMNKAIARKAKPDLKSTRQQKKIMDTKRDHDEEAAKKQSAENKAGKGGGRKVSPAVLAGDKARMDGKGEKDPFTGSGKRKELEKAYKSDDTQQRKLKQDRKRLDFAYDLDKKKEKQGVGSDAGFIDSDEKYRKKALKLELGRRDDLDKKMDAKAKRPKTRMPKSKRPGTIKKK
jgi:hypothetical protein